MTVTDAGVLSIKDLKASVPGREILRGIDLEVRSGEVHAIMGPNGSGKSTLTHVIMGRPGYESVSGSVSIDGLELLGKRTFERARAGLFATMQYPIEVAGVSLEGMLTEAIRAGGGSLDDIHERIANEALRIGFDERFLSRSLNVDLSGGEKKRNETLMLGVLDRRFAILDEIDSGLDVDALRDVSRRIEAATQERNMGVLAITHYTRLLNELKPDVIHILVSGRIVASGGPELADELEREGYAKYGVDEDQEHTPATVNKLRPKIVDPWGGDPLAGR